MTAYEALCCLSYAFTAVMLVGCAAAVWLISTGWHDNDH